METDYYKTISERLLKYCKEGFLCDTVLAADCKGINTHSVLLAAACPKVKAQLVAQEGQVVVLPDIDYDTLCVAVYFIYTGSLMFPSNKEESYYDALKCSLLNLGLDSERIKNSEVVYERESELDFNSVTISDEGVNDETVSDTEIDEVDEKPPIAKKRTTKKSSPGKRVRRRKSGRKTKTQEATPKKKSEEKATPKKKIEPPQKITPRSTRKRGIFSKANDCADEEQNSSRNMKDGDLVDEAGELVIKDEVIDGVIETDIDFSGGAEVGVAMESGAVHKVEAFENERDDDPDYDAGLEDISETESEEEGEVKFGEDLDQYLSSVQDQKYQHRSGMTHRCPKCFRVFSTRAAMFTHKKSHLRGIKKKRESSSSIRAKIMRKMAEEEGRNFECDICDKRFRSRAWLKAHERRTHAPDDEVNKCPVCNRVFETKNKLWRHKLTHVIVGAPVLCHICGKEFRRERQLKRHLERPHHQYKCDKCSAAFNIKRELTNHSLVEHGVYMKLHTEPPNPSASSDDLDKVHLCPICGSGFSSLKPFLMHKLSHRRICSICNERLEGDVQLEQHVKSEHPGHEYVHPFECSICKKVLANEKSLRQHTMRHTGEKPYPCKICGESYRSVMLLSKHVRKMHDDDDDGSSQKTRRGRGPSKKSSLGDRGYEMVGQRILFNDGATKLDINKYQCNTCELIICSYNAMRIHLDNHSGLKFMCKVCKKCFGNQSVFHSHMRIHTNELPFQCRDCGKCFSSYCFSRQLQFEDEDDQFNSFSTNGRMHIQQVSHLNYHMHQHAGTKPYQCRVCDKGYSSNADLRHHYTRVHNIEVTGTKVNKQNTYRLNIPTSAMPAAPVMPASYAGGVWAREGAAVMPDMSRN